MVKNVKIPKNEKVNTFGRSAAIEKNASDKVNKYTLEKLSSLYPGYTISTCNDSIKQKLGVDKILSNGEKSVYIEEKIRYRNYGDILIELIGDNRYYLKRRDALGWSLRDNMTDILVYYYQDTNTGYILSWKKFQRMVFRNLPIWFDYAKKNKNGFALKKTYNDYKGNQWYSLNLAIPLHVFENHYILEGGQIL